MRLIDADVFVHNVVKYSHQSTKTIGQALADTPTVDAIPKSVIEDIKAEIENIGILSSVDIKTGETLYEGLCRYSDVLEIIDKHIGEETVGNTDKLENENDLGDYPDDMPNQFDNMTGSMNL